MSKGKSDIIYGLHSTRHALGQSPGNILEVNIQKDRRTSAELEQLALLARDAGLGLQEVSRSYLDRLCDNALHQGIVIKLRRHTQQPQISLEDLLVPGNAPRLLLVLDGIQDPHNLGACLRTANAAGVDAVIISRDRSVPVNATVSKVASGAVENTALITVTNIARTLRSLQEAGVWIIGTAADATDTLYDMDLRMPTAIVMGSEGKGLRQNTREHCDYLVSLPMRGTVESLNVSVATGICLFEVLRQRGTELV